jgi:hypothetical protein
MLGARSKRTNKRPDNFRPFFIGGLSGLIGTRRKFGVLAAALRKGFPSSTYEEPLSRLHFEYAWSETQSARG